MRGIFKTEVSASYRHVSPKILNEFAKVLDNASLELGKQRDQFRISIESKVENPLMTIERCKRQFQGGEKEREAVKWGWKQEMGKTMFHVVNAYTRGHSLRNCRLRRLSVAEGWRNGVGDGEIKKGFLVPSGSLPGIPEVTREFVSPLRHFRPSCNLNAHAFLILTFPVFTDHSFHAMLIG